MIYMNDWVLKLRAVVLASTMISGCSARLLSLGVAGVRMTRPLCTRIPARFSKLRALVPFAVTSDAIVWTRDQVASLVRKLVIDQLGINEGQYREDAHFVRDFGVD